MKTRFRAVKRFAAAAMAALTAMPLLCGCEESSKAPETPEEFHDAMVERSVVSVGNTERIGKVFDRAAKGENITMAYIGGSITEGYSVGSQSPLCYVSLSAQNFQTDYMQGGTVTCQNNGLSGTPSILGNLRAPKEMLSTNPDVIFIEFAVNDGGEYQYQTAYESLVKTCVEQENQPAVILLFTYMETGHTCQDNQQKIGEHYDLGMISVRDAIVPEMEAGRMVWDDYSDDDVHPNQAGHTLVAEFIDRYFEKAAAVKKSKAYTLPTGTLHPALHLETALWDATNLRFREGAWDMRSSNSHFNAGFTYVPGRENESLWFEVEAKDLFIVYKKAASNNYGMMGVYVNGSLEAIVNGYGVNAWGGPAVDLVYEGETRQKLQVELRMLDDQTEKAFEVFAIGTSGK